MTDVNPDTSLHSQLYLAKDMMNTMTIYLHGEAETPKIDFLPTEFILNDLEADVAVSRILTITNQSCHLPMTLNYVKAPFIFTKPSTFEVPANNSLEILITFKPAKFGSIQNKIVFDLLYKLNFEKNYQNVGKIEVPINLFVTSIKKQPKPKFVTGITPICTNEVGFLTEDVRFNTNINKPRAAMLQSNLKTNDLIAFPNDRSLTLKPWRTDVE